MDCVGVCVWFVWLDPRCTTQAARSSKVGDVVAVMKFAQRQHLTRLGT